MIPAAFPQSLDFSVEGSFGPLCRARVFPAPGSRKLVVSLHGSFGNLLGSSGKYPRFVEAMRSGALAHVVLFETSRLSGDFSSITDSFERKKAAFAGKVFTQELEDARRLLRHSVAASMNYFRVQPEDLEIILSGNSLGGMLAVFLAAEFPQVKVIATAGTGLREDGSSIQGNHLAATMPMNSVISDMAAAFRGRVMGVWGSEDTIFSKEDFGRFLAIFRNASAVGRLVYCGADHSLGMAHGEDSEEPYSLYAQDLIETLTTGVPPSGQQLLSKPSLVAAAEIESQRLEAEIAERVRQLKLKGVALLPDDSTLDTKLP